MLGDGFHDIPPGKVAMVVTFLEMHTPRQRGVPLPDGLKFEEMDPDVASYRNLYRRVGDDWLWYGRNLLPDADLASILNDPRTRYFTLMKDGVAEALLDGLTENAVDFRDNYDGTLTEPAVLPAQFPNLLANGSSGIAVGMATIKVPLQSLE